jgi:hypothetical protein
MVGGIMVKVKSVTREKEGIKIVQDRIPKCTDVLFYDTGLVASIKKSNGTTLYLEVAGEVDINVGEDRYRNDQRFEFIRECNLTDKKLSTMNKADKIRWEMNNWFEVWFENKDGDTDCVLGDVAYDYDEAIKLLYSYAKKNY